MEALNELLEAEKLIQAARYERNKQRQGYSGHYSRNLTAPFGDVTLKVPKLKGISFESAIIERYRRRESKRGKSSHRDVFVWRVSAPCRGYHRGPLGHSKVSPAIISELNKKAYVHIEDWRNRPLQGGRYPYVYVDGNLSASRLGRRV